MNITKTFVFLLFILLFQLDQKEIKIDCKWKVCNKDYCNYYVQSDNEIYLLFDWTIFYINNGKYDYNNIEVNNTYKYKITGKDITKKSVKTIKILWEE